MVGIDLTGWVLHSSSSGPMKAATMVATATPTRSPSHCSARSQYYPNTQPLASPRPTRRWAGVARVVTWHDNDHPHSGIGYVAPLRSPRRPRYRSASRPPRHIITGSAGRVTYGRGQARTPLLSTQKPSHNCNRIASRKTSDNCLDVERISLPQRSSTPACARAKGHANPSSIVARSIRLASRGSDRERIDAHCNVFNVPSAQDTKGHRRPPE